MRRRLGLPVSLACAAVAGAVVTVAVGASTPAPAAPALPRVSTATVLRTDLATTVLTGGTLGYAPGRPVLNELTGTYTRLPAAGSTIRAGQALYRVNNQPAILMKGGTPAWRPFALGMTGGPDVTELQANLIALGYAAGLLAAPTGQFDWLTTDAVRRWQAANGYPVTGQIGLGQVIFLPTAIRVGPLSVSPGQDAAAGAAPYQVTTSSRTVTVPLTPDLPTVTTGEKVSIILPSGASTPGEVTAAGPAGGGVAGAPQAASSVLTVTPSVPGGTGTGSAVPVQVSLTIQAVRQVLAVPVSALLALAGGGYGLEIVPPAGPHRLAAVRTGIFAGGRVQVSGRGISQGTKVVVAQ